MSGRWHHGPNLLVGGLLTAVLVGCGVSTQTQPVALPVRPTPATPSSPSKQNGYAITVYFVQFGRLAPVVRPAPDTSPETALRLLVEGPSTVEAATGLETALVPQRIGTVTGNRRPLTVEVTREFTSIAGDNQLLAAAQLVWTATGNAPHSVVRITVDGKPLEVPTDNGLSRLPVGRNDYTTVGPVEEPQQPGPHSPAPTATPS